MWKLFDVILTEEGRKAEWDEDEHTDQIDGSDDQSQGLGNLNALQFSLSKISKGQFMEPVPYCCGDDSCCEIRLFVHRCGIFTEINAVKVCFYEKFPDVRISQSAMVRNREGSEYRERQHRTAGMRLNARRCPATAITTFITTDEEPIGLRQRKTH